MSHVIGVICTLLLRKYPSIDAVYEYTVSWSHAQKMQHFEERRFEDDGKLSELAVFQVILHPSAKSTYLPGASSTYWLSTRSSSRIVQPTVNNLLC